MEQIEWKKIIEVTKGILDGSILLGQYKNFKVYRKDGKLIIEIKVKEG